MERKVEQKIYRLMNAKAGKKNAMEKKKDREKWENKR